MSFDDCGVDIFGQGTADFRLRFLNFWLSCLPTVY